MDGDRAGAGRPLRSQTADDVLLAVHRRLRRHHVAAAARAAAWLTVVVAAVAVLLHVFVRPIDVVAVAGAVVITWSIALAQASFHPVRDAECAAWADRHLGAESAYETYLEHRDAGIQTPALQRLVAWIDSGARRSVERLASLPGDLRLRKPFAVAAVALLLTAVLLQVPMQTPASAARGASAAAASAGATAEPERRDSASARNADRITGNDNSHSLPAERNDTTSADDRRAAAAGDPSADSTTRAAHSGPNTVPAGEQAAAGGQDAGQTADTLADTGLTEAWQGEMATKLREFGNTDQQLSDVDPTLAADYQSGATPQDAAIATVLAFEPAAAVAPEARSRMRLGPAEQAYVRSYFADSGAIP